MDSRGNPLSINNPSGSAPMTEQDITKRVPAGATRPDRNSRRPRPSKAFLERAKLTAIALSVVAFVGSLAGVIVATPNTKQAIDGLQPAISAPAPSSSANVPQLDSQLSNTEAPLVLPARPQMPSLRPLTRTRGS